MSQAKVRFSACSSSRVLNYSHPSIFSYHSGGLENKFGGLAERKEQQSGSFMGRRRTILAAAAAKKQNMIIEAAFEAVRG
jgi:hypothetical protein